ncbi:50S ribosomal protein L29 [Candidatus Fokinia solitaria]|uniref:Large ribosomal subunit protein uL29 n=1 Tax=Candidatus Fokinia solitaria TaxID=1802984 RepID=A0A2U8BRQ0_9RICK|nr:50S ribosomal protein L29 [Candidatus Fokinia solitaria]AWD33007.1 50S ribosomal protein L29 [Candidatus Fokinia solitaria]
MKFSELHGKTLEELKKIELELRGTLLAKRLSKNVAGYKFVRRDIARVKTMITSICKKKVS